MKKIFINISIYYIKTCFINCILSKLKINKNIIKTIFKLILVNKKNILKN